MKSPLETMSQIVEEYRGRLSSSIVNYLNSIEKRIEGERQSMEAHIVSTYNQDQNVTAHDVWIFVDNEEQIVLKNFLEALDSLQSEDMKAFVNKNRNEMTSFTVLLFSVLLAEATEQGVTFAKPYIPLIRRVFRKISFMLI